MTAGPRSRALSTPLPRASAAANPSRQASPNRGASSAARRASGRSATAASTRSAAVRRDCTSCTTFLGGPCAATIPACSRELPRYPMTTMKRERSRNSSTATTPLLSWSKMAVNCWHSAGPTDTGWAWHKRMMTGNSSAGSSTPLPFLSSFANSPLQTPANSSLMTSLTNSSGMKAITSGSLPRSALSMPMSLCTLRLLYELSGLRSPARPFSLSQRKAMTITNLANSGNSWRRTRPSLPLL
mmetsp:Transcript_67925/g.191464  ORF Transcript_67925/g.191464 Transcript_67925/m.191464 type:complete len:242 (+) Transcript_67925:1238-1963(+)